MKDCTASAMVQTRNGKKGGSQRGKKKTQSKDTTHKTLHTKKNAKAAKNSKRGTKRKATKQTTKGSAKKLKTSKQKTKVAKTSMRDMEKAALASGYKWVIGTDEAGRGPLAGPVVAAACRLPLDVNISGIYDSKQTTEEQREALYAQLVNNPRVAYGVCILDHKTIDDINILNAAMLGMRRSAVQVMEKLGAHPRDSYLLIDGPRYPVLDQIGLPKTWRVAHAEPQEPRPRKGGKKKKQKSLMNFFSGKKTQAADPDATHVAIRKAPHADAEAVGELEPGAVVEELERKDSEHGPKSRRWTRVDWVRTARGWVAAPASGGLGLEPVEDGRLKSEAVIKGDSKCYCIAAASIIAKVTRDRIMKELGKTYPGYGLEANMGYGTKLHRDAIGKLGPTAIHRHSFNPVRTALGFQRSRPEYMAAYAARIVPFKPAAATAPEVASPAVVG